MSAGAKQRKTGEIVSLNKARGKQPELSDAALVAACAIGDSIALSNLYDRHHRLVFHVLRRVSGCTGADLDDLTQQVFLEVWRSAKKFRNKNGGRAWITGITANVARNYVRKMSRARRAHEALWHMELVNSSSKHDQPNISANQLSRALAELSMDRRIAFVLCDVEGMTGPEAASALKVPEGTLWRRLSEARLQLRTFLGAGGEEVA